MADRFLQHKYIRRSGIALNVLRVFYNLFLAESGRGDLVFNDAAAFTIMKRCLHGEAGLLISDLDAEIINLDGLVPVNSRKIMDLYNVFAQTFLPDLICRGIVRRYNADGIIGVDEQGDGTEGMYSHRHEKDGHSWYSVEITTTRVNPTPRIAAKLAKGYDYYIIIYWGRERNPVVEMPDTWWTETQSHCKIYTNMMLRPAILGSINTRIIQYQFALHDIDERQERFLANQRIEQEIKPFYRDYYVDTHHLDDKPAFALMETERPFDKEQFFRDTHACLNLSEAPELVTAPPLPGSEEPDPHVSSQIRHRLQNRRTFKETYAHTPCNLVFPFVEIDDPWIPLEELKYLDLILPGNHFAIKKSAFPPRIAAITYWKFIEVLIEGKRYHEIKEDMQWGALLDHNAITKRYAMAEYPNSIYNGSGFKRKKNKAMNLNGAVMQPFKESDAGQSVLFRCLMDAMEEIDSDSIKNVLPQILSDSFDCPEKEYALWYEEKMGKQAWTFRLKGHAIAARMALTAIGRYKEGKRQTKITYKIIPIRVGKVLIGYWFVPNGHIRTGAQHMQIHAMYFAKDNKYVGATDYSCFKVTSPFMRFHGFTCIYMKQYPCTKNKLYHIRSAGVQGLVTGASHMGDWYNHCEREGYDYDPRTDFTNVFHSYVRETLMILLDSNALQGKSRAMTKLRMQNWAAEKNLDGYSLSRGWWEDILEEEDGVPEEFMQMSLTDFMAKKGIDPGPYNELLWSWGPAARLNCILSEDLPVDFGNGIRLRPWHHGRKYDQYEDPWSGRQNLEDDIDISSDEDL